MEAIEWFEKGKQAMMEGRIEDAIEALLAGMDPEVTNVKAIGCTIKWKE